MFPALVPTDPNTIVPGNLDVTQQPTVQNPDGTRSTVRSISIEEDGHSILIPTVSPDGRVLSNQDAIDLYHRTGKHLGIYGDEQTATRAALNLHESEARRIDTPPAPSMFPQAPPDRLSDAMTRAPGTKPDQAAKIFDLQLKTGLPADVIARNLDQVSTAAAAQGFDAAKFRAESPALASWLEQHPLNASLAQDDLGPLAAVESSVKFAGTAARRFAANVYKGMNVGTWSILQAVGDELGLPGMTAWAKAWNEHLNYVADTIAGPTTYDPAQRPGPVAGGILEGIGAAGAMVPATVAALMGGGEGAMLGILGSNSGAEGVNEARAAGLDRGSSLAYGALKGATTVLTAKIPTHALLGDLAEESGLTKTFAHQIVANIPAMQAQTAIDGYNEWAYLHPDRPFSEFVNANAQMQSLISTIAMVGTQTGAAHAMNKLIGGLASQRAVEQLGRDSAASSVAKIAPGKFDEFVQHAADTGHEAFYAPLDTFNEYWQSKGIDPATKAADLTGDADAYARATQAGDDLRIPAGKLATELASDPAHHQYFADELRIAPDMMNGREADEFQKAEAARSTVAPTTETTAIDEVNKQVTERLTAAGYAPDDAKTNADILARLIGVPALRAGLDPLAVYEKYGLTISRDALKAAPGATLSGSGQPATRPAQAGLDLQDHPVESQPAAPVGDGVLGGGEVGPQYGGVDQVPPDLREHFNAALGDARAAGFTGTDDSLANAYLAHVEEATSIAEQASVGAEEDDRSWRGLLQAVADAGGVGIKANTGKDADLGGRVLQGGSKGEVEELLDQFDRTFAKGRKLRSGGRGDTVQRAVGDVAGIRGIVKRTGGQTLDAVLESLHEGGRFEHIQSQNDLLGELKHAIHDAHDAAANRTTPAHAITNILESLLGVNPTTPWWEASADSLLDPETIGDQAQLVNPPTSFDTFLRQDLFDMIGPDPTVPVENLAGGDLDHQELYRRSVERVLQSVTKAAGRMDLPDDLKAKLAAILGDDDQVAPKVDTLSTGEQQPRLPGDVGDVRDQEVAQPTLGEVADEFKLTAPEETQATQTSLFQPGRAPLDQAGLKAWADELQKEFGPDVAWFDLHLTPAGAIELSALAIARGAQRAGLGSKVMDRLVAFADAHGKRIVLSPSQPGYAADVSKATTSYARLVEFYKRFGFVRNAGKNIDFTILSGMYRDPSVRARATTDAPEPPVDENGETTLTQGEPKAPRGVLRFGPDRQMNIGLFEGANQTTFIHEAGHLALEVFNDLVDGVKAIEEGARTPGQQQLVADQAALFEHLGVADREALRADDAKHEAFTEQLSRYLLKGEAPSISLRRTFARVRSWLLAFYTSLKPHVQNLTPEVRGIFDRMLATDREISDAEAEANIEPMFLTPEAAGMPPERFALYADKVAEASRASREQLQTRLMTELSREQTREWEARKADVRAKVEQEQWALPVYQALAGMQRGTKPDGTPLIEGAEHATPAKLSRQAIVDQFGKDRLKRLPKPYIYTREGGMAPDAVADLFGFTSGDELLTAVENAAPLKDVIAHETERRMLTEHGSLLLDGTLHERAQAAVMNTHRDEVIRDELRALAELKRTVAPFVKAERQAGAAQSAYQARWFEAETKLHVAIAEGRKIGEIERLAEEVKTLRRQARGGAAAIRAALIPDSVLKQIAGDRIAAMPITQLKPATFWSAARRNATKAIEFAARQDFTNAIAAKQQQQIAERMFRDVSDAKDDVEQRVRQTRSLTTLAAQRRIGLAGHGILEQLNDVLGRYNFAPEARSGRAMREWVESLQGESIPGLDVLPDEVLNDVARPYGSLTYEELQGVTDGIAQLAHLATVVNQVLSEQKAKDFGAERDGLVASLYAKHKIRKVKIEITPADETGRFVADIFASHAKLSTLTLLLDAGEDGGPMWEAITRRANAASDAASARNIKAGTEYDALLSKHYTNRERARFGEQLYIPEIQASMSKEMRLEVLKNYGNKTSRDRLLSDPVRKWDQAQVEAIINTLDERDTHYVQDHWDFLNQFWPEIAAKAKRLTGLEPQKVDPLPVRTAYGELRGGYHPLVYDARLDVRAGRAQEIGEAKLAVAGAYLMATTRRGHEKARVAHLSQPIRLEMATTFGHLDQVIHDLTHHEMLIDTTRLLRDRTLAKAIQQTKGDIVYQKLARTLTDIATGDRAPGGAPSIAEKGATWLRQRSQIAGLAYNVWTALQQPLGIGNGIERVGAKWVAKGMTRWLRDAATMQNTAHWIADQSPMMAERLGGRGLTQDLHDVRASMSRKGGWFDKAVRAVSGDHLTQQGILDSYLWHIGLAQSVADVPTWLGAYEKEMASNPADEKRAIALADQAILDSQGGSHIKDLAQVQRGGPLLKLWMTFASYSVMILNATARAAIQTDFKSPAALLRFASRMSMLYVVPNLLTEIMRCGVGRANCDDAKTFIQRVGGQALNTGLNGVLGLRELSAAANIVVGADTGSHGYEGTAGTRLFETMTNAAIQWHQGKWDEGAEKAFFAASGLIFNYPASQVQRSIDGFVALEEGRTSNPMALLVGPPPKEKAQ